VKLRWRGGAHRFDEPAALSPGPRCAPTGHDRQCGVWHLPRRCRHRGILNKQERTTARGLRFTQNLVGNLRRHWNIPRYAAAAEPVAGELMSVAGIEVSGSHLGMGLKPATVRVVMEQLADAR
jgi:hypothetical protein